MKVVTTKLYCDICGAECTPVKQISERLRYVGDGGADVVFDIHAEVFYSTTTGDVCSKCILEAMGKYVERAERERGRTQDEKCRIQNTEYRIQNTEYRIQNTEYWLGELCGITNGLYAKLETSPETLGKLRVVENQLRAINKKSTAAPDLLEALKALRRGSCFCDCAIDNPMMGGKHSDACKNAMAAIAKAEGVAK